MHSKRNHDCYNRGLTLLDIDRNTRVCWLGLAPLHVYVCVCVRVGSDQRLLRRVHAGEWIHTERRHSSLAEVGQQLSEGEENKWGKGQIVPRPADGS